MRFIVVLTCVMLSACGGTISEDASPTPTQAPSPVPRTNCPDHNLWQQTDSPWLQKSPNIHLVFWGQFWINKGITEMKYYSDAWQVLANDPAFYKPMQEYGIGRGTLVGIYNTNPYLLAGNISDQDIRLELISEISNGQLPSVDTNDMYVLMLPPTTVALSCAKGNCSGYHSNINSLNGLTYQVIDYDVSHINTNSVVSHEIYESATDANGNGYHGVGGEAEVGDFCGGENYLLDNYLIQRVWSQNDCQCLPSYPVPANIPSTIITHIRP